MRTGAYLRFATVRTLWDSRRSQSAPRTRPETRPQNEREYSGYASSARTPRRRCRLPAPLGSAIGNLVFFPLLFTASVFTVIERGTVLYDIARVTPLGAASQIMSYGSFGGDVFPWVQIIALAVWTLVLTPLAVKFFKRR